jgi:hypothetical protein
MPTRHMLRQRTDACRRRRVAFFILPLDGEPMEAAVDPGGRAWHERADTDFEADHALQGTSQEAPR